MRKSAIILAALLTARPTLAAEQCLEVKTKPQYRPGYNKRFHMCFSQPYLICDPDATCDGNLPKQLETY